MSKIWLIARHHFQKETSKKSFLFILLSMPLFLVLSIGLGMLFESLENDNVTVGYVDPGAFLQLTVLEDADEDIQLIVFPDQVSAREALEKNEVDAYYLLPADYPESIEVDLVYLEDADGRATSLIRRLIRLNLLAGQSPEIAGRLLSGANVTVFATEANREYPKGGPEPGLFLPILGAFVFGFLTMTTSGYMLQVMVEEKENRTMEIIISSVSPSQLMSGKIVGALGIAFVQLTVWAVFFVIALWVSRSIMNVAWLQDVKPVYQDLVKMAVVAFPAYLFMAALMTLIGATLVDTQEAEQVGPMAFLVTVIPLFLIIPLAANPNGTLALILTLIPFTSVLTLAIRSIFIVVPAWQVLASCSISFICAGVAIWLAGKAFRLSLLRYGQRLKFRELLSRRSSKTLPAS
jgi:ABC-2 type transport system permease protein